MSIRLQFKLLRDGAKLPTVAHIGDAGFDLRWVPRPGDADPAAHGGRWYEFPLGLAAEIPFGWYIQLRERSGLARQFGIQLLGGTIDCGYRGEIVAILSVPTIDIWAQVALKPGDRICQGVVLPVQQLAISSVDELSPTSRGAAGLGSTGLT